MMSRLGGDAKQARGYNKAKPKRMHKCGHSFSVPHFFSKCQPTFMHNADLAVHEIEAALKPTATRRSPYGCQAKPKPKPRRMAKPKPLAKPKPMALANA